MSGGFDAGRRFLTTLGLVAGLVASGTAARRTVWDGVFSTAQADRGQAQYTKICVDCHGKNLEGDRDRGGIGGGGVALSGPTFATNWDSATLNDLFQHVSKTMPANAPGSLTGPQSLELIAYVMRFNGFPVGSADLTADVEALANVDIVGKNGFLAPGPGTPVRAVGCLAKGAGGIWVLNQASAPVRTKGIGASTGPDFGRAQTTALGTMTVRLLNPSTATDAQLGAKAEAKGMLVKAADGDRISVLSLQVIAPLCVP